MTRLQQSIQDLKIEFGDEANDQKVIQASFHKTHTLSWVHLKPVYFCKMWMLYKLIQCLLLFCFKNIKPIFIILSTEMKYV